MARQAHRIQYDQPVTPDEAFRVNLLDPALKLGDMAYLYLIAIETSGGKDIDRFCRQKMATSRFVVAQLLLHDNILGSLRRLSPDVKITREIWPTSFGTGLEAGNSAGQQRRGCLKEVKRLTRRRQRQRAAVDKLEAATPLSP
jgi:hypothetical protein